MRPADANGLAERKRALYADAPPHPPGDLAAWRHTVVFAPHPDDEALGCGGLISLLSDRGQAVDVVFVSDGGMSHPNSQAYDRDQRIRLRETEARAACRHLGVAEDRVHFLRLPDGQVPAEHLPEFPAAVQRLRALTDAWRADTFVVPWRRDVHEDHLATWDLCRAIAADAEYLLRWIEYPVWMWQTGAAVDLPRAGEMIAWSLDVSDRLPRKEAAIRLHASQWAGLITDDPTGFQLPDTMIDTFLRPREIYLEPAEKQAHSLGEGYFERVYAASDDPWQFETSDYEHRKYAATLAALPDTRYAAALEIGCSVGVLTEQLATRCERLLAIDINAAALERARQRLGGTASVTFERRVLPGEFPAGTFDLIVLSEVGYYWSHDDLATAIRHIRDALRPGGVLVLVHYTPYVPDYPLTGDEVHAAFARALTEYDQVRQDRQERYRLEVYRKRGGRAPRP